MKSQMAELLECFELPSVIWSLGWQGANSETGRYKKIESVLFFMRVRTMEWKGSVLTAGLYFRVRPLLT